MRRDRLLLAGAFALAVSSPAQAKNTKGWAVGSDIGVIGLSAAAIGWPVLNHDRAGALQAGGSIAAATLVTTGLKNAFPETRPDRSDRKSFPSGHTSTAFAAAASLYERQGARVGIPAFALASFVGVARVKADKHHWYDVVAGAGIGITTGLLVTRRRNKDVAVIPYGDTKGGGIVVAMRF